VYVGRLRLKIDDQQAFPLEGWTQGCLDCISRSWAACVWKGYLKLPSSPVRGETELPSHGKGSRKGG
jgi:hypothetical protein